MTRLLQHYARDQADRRPDADAIVLGERRIAYGDLDQRGNQLAHALREAGCRRGDRVCLFTEKSPAAVVGMHGVLKADAAYVPIDLSSPRSRIARIVRSCEPRAVLVDDAGAKVLEAMLEERVIDVPEVVGSVDGASLESEHFTRRFDSSTLSRYETSAPASVNTPDDPAHVLFTSGSTGDPKGVVITHSNAVAFVDWGREYFGISEDDRNSGHPPLHFDLSTFDVFGSLSAGAELHMVPASLNLVPPKLADFVHESRLTQWFSVPTVLTMLAHCDALGRHDFPHLKRLLWCGEVLPTPTLLYLMDRLPHVRFTNLYGPTEATIASSYHTLAERPADERAEVPIGEPCTGESLHVLDERLEPVEPGTVGDLYIGGVGLSPGYWRDPVKTDDVFLTRQGPDGPQRVYRTGDLARVGDDGLFYFHGRQDTQVKSRGYRIELGEIETAMNALGMLADCAVVGVPTGGFEGTAICCAFVPKPDADVTPQRLRREVASLIPNYMLPGRWQGFPRLPKNGNGKTDRRRLKEIFETN